MLNGICAVYDQMIAQRAGHIVNLSSICGKYPVPSTRIASGVVNFDAGSGITGVNFQKFFERFGGIMDGSAPPAWSDPHHIEYFMLAPEELADQIIYVIDHPGVFPSATLRSGPAATCMSFSREHEASNS